jgi:hypothetical protein
MNRTIAISATLLLVFAFISSLFAEESSSGKSEATTGVTAPELPWKVISGGGTDATSGAMRLRGTVGQTATNFSAAGALELNAGFWQNFNFGGGGCCIGIRGDADGNGTDNTVLDLTYIINDIFRGGPPSPCPEESDLDGDGSPATVLDLTFIINDIYRGGPAPGPCL